MSSALNILFICSWYPSRETAKLGNFIQRHAEAVATLHKVTVLYVIDSDENETEITQSGNLTEHIVYFKKLIPLYNYYSTASRYLKELMAAGKFDLVHFQVAYPAAVLTSHITIPYVVTEHFSGYQPASGFKWGFLRKRITQKALNEAACIMPVSEHLGKAIKEFGVSNKFRKVSNVVDTSYFYPADIKPARFTFLHVSSLEERSKNIEGILLGFKVLQDRNVDFLLKIGGDGDPDELHRKIKKSGIAFKNIETFGALPIDGIAQKMRESCALVMFSHFENQPCTILEALCSGLPVVTSDVGGIPEEIDNSNGILIPRGDMNSFVLGLEEIINDYSSYDLPEIARQASGKYGIEAIANTISEVYATALNAGS